MAHFAIIRGSEKFVMFDHGAEQNVVLYGQIEPPEIDLKGITVPTALFIGKQDELATPEAGSWLANELANCVCYKELDDVDHASFNFGSDMGYVTEILE